MNEFKTPPWPHQLEAFNAAYDKRAFMLALGMGYGKSKIVIDLIHNRGHRRVLIVCPKSVMSVWPKQFLLHDPLGAGRAVSVLGTGSCRDRADDLRSMVKTHDKLQRPLVIVLNYDAYWQQSLGDAVEETRWDLVVLDESHRIKSPGGRASWKAKRLKADWKLCCTGTPMPHSPLDIYAQYRFLDPQIFGTNFTLFRMRYARLGGYLGKQVVGYSNLEELHARFHSIAFRSDADLGLPEVQHIVRDFDLSPLGRRVYKGLEDDLMAELDSGVISAANGLVKLLRLQQVTGGVVKSDDGVEETVDWGKRTLLRDVLEDLPADEPVVVFCRFRADLDALEEICTDLGRTSGELSGRRNDLTDWQAGGAAVLGVQIQAGGLGVDLTRARYCLYYSVGFSLGDYEQSLARVHRPGQKRGAIFIHLVARKSIDEEVYAALRAKKDVVETVLARLLVTDEIKIRSKAAT